MSWLNDIGQSILQSIKSSGPFSQKKKTPDGIGDDGLSPPALNPDSINTGHVPFDRAQAILRGDTGMFGNESTRPMGPRSVIQGINPNADDDAAYDSMPTDAKAQGVSSRGIPSMEEAVAGRKKAGWGDILANAATIFIPSLASGIASSKAGEYGGFGGGMASGLVKSFPQFVENQMARQHEQRLSEKQLMGDPARIVAYQKAKQRTMKGDQMFDSGRKTFDEMMSDEMAKIKTDQLAAELAHKQYGTTGYGLYQKLMDEGRVEDAKRIQDMMIQNSARGELATMLARDPRLGVQGALDLSQRTRAKYRPRTSADNESEYLDAVERVTSRKPAQGDAEKIAAFEALQAQKRGGRRGRSSSGGGANLLVP